MHRIFSLISLAAVLHVVLAGLSACDDSDSFTTDAGALLSFSTDTIRFDTVITTVGSSTRRIQVYNPNDKGVRIAMVSLQKGERTPFRVNVDGTYLEPESGARAYDFEVRGKDSIHVFAEVTVPSWMQDAPFEMTDTLLFMLESGVQQRVILTAVGQDAYMWRGKVIQADTVCETVRPIVIYDSLVVAEGATLTLNPGVQLYFHDGANLLVRGTLKAAGTHAKPVVFRGDRTDNMFDYLPYDNTPSRWGGIILYASSMDNTFDYADIHSASFGIRCDSSATDRTKLTLTNSVLHNIGGEGLGLYHCRSYVSNTQISNTQGNCVSVVGGWTEFLHCTIAQFYPWTAERGDALYLANKWLSAPYPLEHAAFRNCLITGYAEDVVMGGLEDPDQNLDYYFGHCLLRTVESDDAVRFVGIVYDKDSNEGGQEKHFRRFDTDNYLYDFRLDSLSAARNIGAKEWAADCPTDYDGQSRLEDAAPDAGCYEFKSQP